MFKIFSWGNYWEFVLITLFVYYAMVGCLYYLSEIKQVFSGKSNMLLKLSNFKELNTDEKNINASNKEAENELPEFVQEYLNDAKRIIEYAAENNTVKQELLYSLQRLSQNHLKIKSTPFQKFTNNYILNETLNHSAIYLNEDDVNALWL